MNAEAPIKETRGAEAEEGVSREFCEGSFAAWADDVRGGDYGASNCGQNVILPNTQSINGL